MPAINTDLLKKLSRKWVSQIGSGGVDDAVVTTIPLSSVTNLPTDTAVVATIDRVDANGVKTPTLEESVIGVVSGTNLATCVRGAEGTAQAHAAGAVVEILVTAKGFNDIVDWGLVEHSQLGVHDKTKVVDLTTAQTLTTKTLTSPVINTGFSGTAKATGATITTGTADTTIVTPKALADATVGKIGANWTVTTPTPTAGSGSFTTASCIMNHIQLGKIVFIALSVTITTNGTAADSVIVPLPVNLTGQAAILPGRESGVTGKMLQGFLGTTTCTIFDYANNYCGGDGYVLFVSGSYQCV